MVYGKARILQLVHCFSVIMPHTHSDAIPTRPPSTTRKSNCTTASSFLSTEIDTFSCVKHVQEAFFNSLKIKRRVNFLPIGIQTGA